MNSEEGQELDLVVLVDPIQLSIFYDSVNTGPQSSSIFLDVEFYEICILTSHLSMNYLWIGQLLSFQISSGSRNRICVHVQTGLRTVGDSGTTFEGEKHLTICY